MNIFLKFMQDENGATAIEYGLIAALIAVVIIGALGAVGSSLSSKFQIIADKLGETSTPASSGTGS